MHKPVKLEVKYRSKGQKGAIRARVLPFPLEKISILIDILIKEPKMYEIDEKQQYQTHSSTYHIIKRQLMIVAIVHILKSQEDDPSCQLNHANQGAENGLKVHFLVETF